MEKKKKNKWINIAINIAVIVFLLLLIEAGLHPLLALLFYVLFWVGRIYLGYRNNKDVFKAHIENIKTGVELMKKEKEDRRK